MKEITLSILESVYDDIMCSNHSRSIRGPLCHYSEYNREKQQARLRFKSEVNYNSFMDLNQERIKRRA